MSREKSTKIVEKGGGLEGPKNNQSEVKSCAEKYTLNRFSRVHAERGWKGGGGGRPKRERTKEGRRQLFAQRRPIAYMVGRRISWERKTRLWKRRGQEK